MTAPLALLFDLDGTLVDTDRHHVAAWSELLAEAGRTLTLEDYRTRVMGAPNDAIMAFLFPEHGPERQAELADRKEAIFRASVASLEPAKGLLALLGWAGRHDVPCGVVTNAPRLNATLMLAGLGLADRFPVLVIGEELANGKPHPLPYLTGMQRLGAAPANTLAFEDSLSGIRSAAAAGIYTYGMRTALPDAALREAGASAVIADFTDAHLLATLDAALAGAMP